MTVGQHSFVTRPRLAKLRLFFPLNDSPSRRPLGSRVEAPEERKGRSPNTPGGRPLLRLCHLWPALLCVGSLALVARLSHGSQNYDPVTSQPEVSPAGTWVQDTLLGTQGPGEGS